MIEEIQQFGLPLRETQPGDVGRFASHATTLSGCAWATTCRACVRLNRAPPVGGREPGREPTPSVGHVPGDGVPVTMDPSAPPRRPVS
jgi:hypothetical protein